MINKKKWKIIQILKLYDSTSCNVTEDLLMASEKFLEISPYDS